MAFFHSNFYLENKNKRKPQKRLNRWWNPKEKGHLKAF